MACAVAIDMGTATGDADWKARAAFLTPIAKAFGTDTGISVAEMGVQGTAVTAEYGGVEAGYLTLCLAAQELGAHLAAVPFSSCQKPPKTIPSVGVVTAALLMLAGYRKAASTSLSDTHQPPLKN